MNLAELPSPLRKTAYALALAALFAPTAEAAPGDLLGPAITVAGTAAYTPAVARNAAGEFIVVWANDFFDSAPGAIAARLFAADGTPAGPAFAVTGGRGRTPSVAMNAEGAFVVSWIDDIERSVEARVYDAGAVPRSGELTIATGIEGQYTAEGINPESAVAIDDDGDFVVGWSVAAPHPGTRIGDVPYLFSGIPLYAPGIDRVYARRFNADGTASGSPRLLDERASLRFDSGNKSLSVAMSASGAYAVVWSFADALGRSHVYGRRFKADGGNDGLKFRVDDAQVSVGDDSEASAAMDPAGGLLVTWKERLGVLNSDLRYRIKVKAYAANGSVRLPEFDPFAGVQAVPAYDLGARPRIAVDPLGAFVISTDEGTIDSQSGYTVSSVVVRLFQASGAPLSGKQTLAVGTQYGAANGVAMDAAGSPVVSYIRALNPRGVFAQRLLGP